LRIMASQTLGSNRHGTAARAGAGFDTTALDAAVADLRAGVSSWVGLPLEERIALVRATRRRVGEEAEGVVAAGCAAQGLSMDSPWARDLWSGWLPFVLHLSALEEVLGRVAAGREPLPVGVVHTRADEQVVVDVVPATRTDRLMFAGAGLRGQVWMQPGMTQEQVRAGAARAYRGEGFDSPGVALVLGAGNFAFLPASDTLHMLFSQGCVVALKLNAVNAYLQPFLERVFADFVDHGWLRFVDSGVAAGTYLAHHPGIDRLHMTGSASTYDALVWGTGTAASRNRRAGTPLLDKPFTAELGGVCPVIVVPGPWSDADVRRQADRIAITKLLNCGHVCNATQVLVMPEGWKQGAALLDEIRQFLRALPPRAPYYPGTEAKVARAVDGQASCEALQGPDRRFLLTGLDPDSDASFFRDEVFADVLGVVELPAPDAASYLASAVTFCNERLAGDLAATMLVHPATAQGDALAVERAIADLRVGAVGVNEWAVMSGSLGYTTWGGFPGNSPEDIGSGVGVVGNWFMLDRPEKSVVHAAFHPRSKPLATASHRTLAALTRGVVRYRTTGDLRALPGVLVAALRA
jgi:acyl-CoA reductase-like NAD-dependent aldehyde dehydrogenase